MNDNLDFYKWFKNIAPKLAHREISFKKIFKYFVLFIILRLIIFYFINYYVFFQKIYVLLYVKAFLDIVMMSIFFGLTLFFNLKLIKQLFNYKS